MQVPVLSEFHGNQTLMQVANLQHDFSQVKVKESEPAKGAKSIKGMLMTEIMS